MAQAVASERSVDLAPVSGDFIGCGRDALRRGEAVRQAALHEVAQVVDVAGLNRLAEDGGGELRRGFADPRFPLRIGCGRSGASHERHEHQRCCGGHEAA